MDLFTNLLLPALANNLSGMMFDGETPRQNLNTSMEYLECFDSLEF